MAVIGNNRKAVAVPLCRSWLPPMKRGQGVTSEIQKVGGLSDLKLFTFKNGLSWALGGRVPSRPQAVMAGQPA